MSFRKFTQNVLRIKKNTRKNWRAGQTLSVSLDEDDDDMDDGVPGETIELSPRDKNKESVSKLTPTPPPTPTTLSEASRHFRRRTCRKFAPRNNQFCWCGRTKEEHAEKENNSNESTVGSIAAVVDVNNIDQWETYYATCSDAVDETNAFGTLHFTVDGVGEHDYWFAETERRYIRLDKDTSANLLYENILLKKEEWNMGKPELIISVVGDVGDADAVFSCDRACNADVKNAFRNCLLDVFKDTPNSWVLTNGIHSGIGKYVGKVVKEINITKNKVEEKNENVSITCIGVAPWGFVKDKEKLVDETSRRPRWPKKANYDVSTSPDKGRRKEEYLDPNHTHFLLVDDGTVGRFEEKIPFTFRDKMMEISSCPCANLLVGGEHAALDDVIHSLSKTERTSKSLSSIDDVYGGYKTPCIVIKGSGKAADLIALGKELLKVGGKGQDRGKRVDDVVKSKAIADLMEREFGEKEAKNLRWRLKKCLENHELIYVFDPNEDERVNVEVLKAFHRHGKGTNWEKLHVAYAWKRIDVATEIWRDMLSRNEDVYSDQWVMKALAEGNLEFVQLFLDHATNKGDFLTQPQLEELYTKLTSKSKQKRIVRFLQQETVTDVLGYESYMRNLLSFFVNEQRGDDINPDSDGSSLIPENGNDNGKKQYTQTCADLFVWCVLAGHYELARTFMSSQRYPIAHGLMAANILRGLIVTAETTVEKSLLEEKASEFEQFSIQILRKCYDTNPLKTKFVLVQGLDIFDGTSCMELAVRDEHCLEFICHPACQSHFTDIWRRCHKKDLGTYWKVAFLSVVLCAQLFLSPITYARAKISFSSGTLALVVIAFAIIINIALIMNCAVRGMKSMRKTKKSGKDFKELKGQESTNNYLYSIGIDCGYSKSSLSQHRADCVTNLTDFFKAPVIKFYLHTISYVVYLALYIYFLIFDTHPDFTQEIPSTCETIVYFFWISFLAQEIKQIAKNDLSVPMDKKSRFGSIWCQILQHFRIYLNSAWNCFDIFLVVTTITIGSCRFAMFHSEPGPIYKNLEQYLTLGYSVVFAFFFARLLQFFLVNIHLGPKLLMIKQMLLDLLYFSLFIGIFWLAYCLVSHTMMEALKDNRERPFSIDLIADLFRWGFWNLFGETFQDEIKELYEEVKNVTRIHQLPSYPELTTRILVPTLQAIYMFITVILLLNLLIATFTYNITKLQEKEHKLWFIHRKGVIFENFNRPALPQPFSLIINVRDWAIWIRKRFSDKAVRCCSSTPSIFTCRMLCISTNENVPKHMEGRKILKRMERWESLMAKSAQEAQLVAGQTDNAYNIKEIKESVRKLTKMQILEDVSLENLDVSGKLDKVEEALSKMSKQLKHQEDESQKLLTQKCEPCRRNCSACQKLVDADKFYFEDDGDAYFVQDKSDCNSSGFIVGITCTKCEATKPLITEIIEGFSTVETPRSIPFPQNKLERSQNVASAEGSRDPRVNYLKKTFRDVVAETSLSLPAHFKNENHIPSRHMKFIGIESINLRNKRGIQERVQFWKNKIPRS